MYNVVLIDRDGVIDADVPGYVKKPEELDIFPYVKNALARLRRAGYLIFIVSNQSGVGRGLMTAEDLDEVTKELVSAVGPFDGIFYCIHKPEDGCDCRKPLPGLLLKALADAETRGSVSEAWMVGDSVTDIAAGASAGCRTILVGSGSRADFDNEPDYVAADLAEAVDVVLSGG